jgi:hypothetical protein
MASSQSLAKEPKSTKSTQLLLSMQGRKPMPLGNNLFWHLKWRIREKLLAKFNAEELQVVQIEKSAIHRFLTELVRDEAPGLNPVVLDCLVPELIKEFFTDKPLIKATVLNLPQRQ